MIPNPPLIFVQRLKNIRSHAGKVDVQLILGTAYTRVDGQGNFISRKVSVQRLVDVRSDFPSVREIVRRIQPANDGALDSGNLSGGNEQELRAPSRVPEDREPPIDPSIQIDFEAGLGIVNLQLSGDADIVHNFPERIARQFYLARKDFSKEETGANENSQDSRHTECLAAAI
jgi:hypothetical protein